MPAPLPSFIPTPFPLYLHSSPPSTCLLNRSQLFRVGCIGSYQTDCLSLCIPLSFLGSCTSCLSAIKTFLHPWKAGWALIFSPALHITIIYIHNQTNCTVQVHWEFKMLVWVMKKRYDELHAPFSLWRCMHGKTKWVTPYTLLLTAEELSRSSHYTQKKCETKCKQWDNKWNKHLPQRLSVYIKYDGCYILWLNLL